MQLLMLWTTIGALLTLTGFLPDGWEFWCFMGTYWAVGQLHRGQGQLEGLINFLSLSDADQQRIRQAYQRISKETK